MTLIQLRSSFIVSGRFPFFVRFSFQFLFVTLMTGSREEAKNSHHYIVFYVRFDGLLLQQEIMRTEAVRLNASSLQDVEHLQNQLESERSLVAQLRKHVATQPSLAPSSPSSKGKITESPPLSPPPSQRKFAEESMRQARLTYGAPVSPPISMKSIRAGGSTSRPGSSQGSFGSNASPSSRGAAIRPSTSGGRNRPLSPLLGARRVFPSQETEDDSRSGEVPPSEFNEFIL